MKVILFKALELLLSQLLGRVEILPLKVWIEHTIIKLKTVVQILTDDDKDNKKQLKMFWTAIQDDFKHESLEAVILIVQSKVHDQHLRDLIVESIKEAIKQNKNTTLGMSGLVA